MLKKSDVLEASSMSPNASRRTGFGIAVLSVLAAPAVFCYIPNQELTRRRQFRVHRIAPSRVRYPQPVLFSLDLPESKAESDDSTLDNESDFSNFSGVSTQVNGAKLESRDPKGVDEDDCPRTSTQVANGYKIFSNPTDKEVDTEPGGGFPFPNSMPIRQIGQTNGYYFFNITRMPAESFSSNFEKAKTIFFQKSLEEPTSKSESWKETSLFSDGQQFTANITNKTLAPFRGLYRYALDQARVLRNGNQVSSENKTSITSDTEGLSPTEPEALSLRRLWRRRHARTLEEGIRREKATELSDLLNRAQIDARPEGRKYIERTLMGLINALAEEIEDLDIELKTKPKTPCWRKEVQEIRINFSRLGFKPIRMGGSDKYDRKGNAILKEAFGDEEEGLSLVESADEAFDRIDKDKSGTLDREEIAEALSMISELETDKNSIDELASELVSLYDVNSDGVVDREEYQQMVEDMAKLRAPSSEKVDDKKASPLKKVKDSVQSISKGISEKAAQVAAAATSRTGAPEFDPNEREMGSIVLSDLNLDLRRLAFGGLPVVKRITPGGPLILEPFTTTIRGSFTREDVMGSFLLDMGLRLLVARAIRVRVRSFRDVVDGAYFFGRQWKMASKSAPVVQVLGLSNVEFSGDKMILTGRARIRTSPDAPVVTNTFKVRTKIGTGNNGQTIGLREPELAFVFECPQTWENGLSVVYEAMGMPPPKRPEPLYSFFPIYSPFKVNENAGFDMGEDNQLRKIFIKDGKLRFEMRSVLRPGRFLGSHYLAFTLPMRTFIITMDRVKEGIRVARKNKKIAAREKRLLQDVDGAKKGKGRDVSGRRIFQSAREFASRRRVFPSMFRLPAQQPKPKSFFARFVEGYTLVEREGEAKNEQLTNEISDWFGRQGNFKSNETPTLDLKDMTFGDSDESRVQENIEND